jgi:hypothetical protein
MRAGTRAHVCAARGRAETPLDARSPAQRTARERLIRAGADWWVCRTASAAMWALKRSGVRFRKIVHPDGRAERWRQPRLAPWEVPRRDPAERRPNAPEVVAERLEVNRRWRERKLASAVEAATKPRDDGVRAIERRWTIAGKRSGLGRMKSPALANAPWRTAGPEAPPQPTCERNHSEFLRALGMSRWGNSACSANLTGATAIGAAPQGKSWHASDRDGPS